MDPLCNSPTSPFECRRRQSTDWVWSEHFAFQSRSRLWWARSRRPSSWQFSVCSSSPNSGQTHCSPPPGRIRCESHCPRLWMQCHVSSSSRSGPGEWRARPCTVGRLSVWTCRRWLSLYRSAPGSCLLGPTPLDTAKVCRPVHRRRGDRHPSWCSSPPGHWPRL